MMIQTLDPKQWSFPMRTFFWPLPEWSKERKKEVPTLVYHWAADPGATLGNMWEYYRRVATKRVGYHALIKEEVMHTIPWNMTSRALYWKNPCLYPEATQKRFGKCQWPDDYAFNLLILEDDWAGHYSETTLHNAAMLGAFLCWYYQADPVEDVFRHTDIDGKGLIYGTDGYTCPRYFYENPDEWEGFKLKIKEIVVKRANGGER